MTEIIPAIMPKNLADLEEKAKLVYPYVKTIQLDLMDGNFVDAKTWPFSPKDREDVDGILKGKALPFADVISYELDLMVVSPEKDLKKYLAMRPSRIIFHARSLEDHASFVDLLNASDMKADVEVGIAIQPHEDLAFADTLIKAADFVQVMGIKDIGKQGEMLDENVFAQIEHLKATYPDVIISIDGGVNMDNASRLKAAGVSRLVSGSAIFKSDDIEGAINTLKNG